MPTTYAIPDGRTVMAATLYTGNGTTQSINNAVNGVSFQPDWAWVKSRNTTEAQIWIDSVRGVGQELESNNTNAEYYNANSIQSFNSNGYTSGSSNTNVATRTYVAWQWKAGGTAVSNTAGSITSSVSANVSAGFSVVTYTGTGANATVGHGLGVAPSMLIVKSRSTAATDWKVYNVNVGNTFQGFLNDTAAFQGSSPTLWNSTTPTSTVFSIGTNAGVNQSSATLVAYCFAPVAGYSAFGSYTGNGSTDGPFVYLGFRPRFILIRSTSNLREWFLVDTSRNSFNVANSPIRANTSAAEGSDTITDIVSNGFKLRSSDTAFNGSGETYIYMAFAENPFKYANAR